MIWLRKGKGDELFENGNEPAGSIKVGNFLPN